jgi:hypothetical protein
MPWYHYVAYAFGGLFFANAVPHLVAGMMGRAFQSPFANPPGEGLSSSLVNALWGAFNLIVAYLLLWHVGTFRLARFADAAVAGVPALGMAIMLARHFGRFNGGNPIAARRD